eukprot:GHVU01215116.1.p1 GENE.GHVU01215116.1~~GHVU01215116.1.p1  ORF type:complete len:157 (+),score=1.17 GHVU01215116.1:93-563(+)
MRAVTVSARNGKRETERGQRKWGVTSETYRPKTGPSIQVETELLLWISAVQRRFQLEVFPLRGWSNAVKQTFVASVQGAASFSSGVVRRHSAGGPSLMKRHRVSPKGGCTYESDRQTRIAADQTDKNRFRRPLYLGGCCVDRVFCVPATTHWPNTA